MSVSFRNTAAFGKRIEFFVIGLMLKQGLDVYLPLVDDNAIDAVVKRPDGRFVEVQIKARSSVVDLGGAGFFPGLRHDLRKNYWFIFYAERMDTMWIMSSGEFIREALQNKNGKSAGTRAIWFTGKNTKRNTEHVKPRFLKYVETNFRRIQEDDPDAPFDE
jgi:hypothetical protein